MMRQGGDMVGDYRLGPELGRDSSGMLFSAEDVRTGAPVVVKELAPDLAADNQFLERFRAEMAVLTRLEHPNCDRVVDFLEVDSRYYVVSDQIDGRSLREVMNSTALRPGQALALLRGTLVGLGAAHAAGVLHRSLRPESVLLQPDGLVKVTAFDQPAYFGGPSGGPGAAESISPYAYIAPEQVLGAPEDVRTDVYLAGILGFELLAGAPPFAASDPSELMSMHVAQDPPDLTQLRPEVTAPAADMISRALAKAPDDRQQSAREFIAQIDALTAALGIEWTEAVLVSGLASIGLPLAATAGQTGGVERGGGAAAAGGGIRRGRTPRGVLVPGVAALVLALSGAAYGYSQRWLGVGGGAGAGPSSTATSHGQAPTPFLGGSHRTGGAPVGLALAPPSNSAPPPAAVAPVEPVPRGVVELQSARLWTLLFSPALAAAVQPPVSPPTTPGPAPKPPTGRPPAPKPDKGDNPNVQSGPGNHDRGRDHRDRQEGDGRGDGQGDGQGDGHGDGRHHHGDAGQGENH